MLNMNIRFYTYILCWSHIIWKLSNFFLFPPSLFLPLPFFSIFFLLCCSLSFPWIPFSPQLSPEEGYVSAKEDSFLYPPHSCEEEGLADKPLFRADLALVSGYDLPSFLSETWCILLCLSKYSEEIYYILCSLLYFGKINMFSPT